MHGEGYVRRGLGFLRIMCFRLPQGKRTQGEGRSLEEVLLRELFAQGVLFVLLLDGRGVLYLSESLRALLGLPGSPRLVYPLGDLFSPEAANRLMQVLHTQETGVFPVRLRCAGKPEGGPDGWVTLHMVSRWIPGEGEGMLMLYTLQNGGLQTLSSEGPSLAQDPEDFMAMLSHEIRTPVSSLLGFLTLLEGTPLNQEQANYVGAMHGLANSIQGLLSDALDEFRLRAGELKLHYTYFDLRSELSRLLKQYSLQHGHLTLSMDYAQEVPDVLRGDAHRVLQMVTNLLTNALKYTPKGGVHIQVSRVQAPDVPDAERMVSIAVRDTGVGIPQSQQERVFKAFTQVQGGGGHQGFGLGLHITRQLVDLHGGVVRLQSEENVGSTITLILPLLRDWVRSEAVEAQFLFASRADAPASPTIHEPFPNPGADASPRGIKGGREEREGEGKSAGSKPGIQPGPPAGASVLLVDDNAVNILVEKKFFDRWGYPVDVARSGEEALELVRDHDYGLIFMDLRMPGLDGYETTLRIRAMPPPRCNVPIIALTASTEQGVRTRIFECGMQGYIFKPFNANDLREHLVRYVGDPPGRTQL